VLTASQLLVFSLEAFKPSKPVFEPAIVDFWPRGYYRHGLRHVSFRRRPRPPSCSLPPSKTASTRAACQLPQLPLSSILSLGTVLPVVGSCWKLHGRRKTTSASQGQSISSHHAHCCQLQLTRPAINTRG